MISLKSPSRMTLRPYQQEMKREIYSYIRAGTQRILAVVIMGAGKTVLASAIMSDVVDRGHRCVFLVKLNVLIDQTLDALRDYGINATALQGNRKVDPDAPVLVASIQTIAARLRNGQALDQLIGRPRLVVVDEAHIGSFDSTYPEIERYALRHGGTTLGLTATPWRLSREEYLGQRFDALVEGPQPPEVIRLGSALPCRPFSAGGVIDLDEVRVQAGEFVDSDIANQATRPAALANVVVEWQRLCSGRPSMMVGATIAQAQLTAEAFNDAGIKAETIIGSTPPVERKAIFGRVQSGETQIICSVGCLTAGFNLPCLSAIVYVRATKSKALFHQTAGRGSRPYPGKEDYLLLDFGGNLKRHGNPMWKQSYYIGPRPPIDDPPTKTCPDCSAEVPLGARICPECGHEFPPPERPKDEDPAAPQFCPVLLGEHLDRTALRFIRKRRRENYNLNISPDIAPHEFYEAYGYNAPAEWMQGAIFGKRFTKPNKQRFLEYLQQHCNLPAGPNADAWYRFHWRLEFGQRGLGDQADPSWGEILGIDSNASWEEIKLAYRKAIASIDATDAEAIAALNEAFDEAKNER